MYSFKSSHMVVTLAAILFSTFAQPVSANDLSPSLTEEFIQETLISEPDETLKLSECTDETYIRCTYVWGKPHKKDDARLKAGYKPEGKVLMIIVSQARSAANFEPVISGYTDPEPIDNLGIAAVWSQRRHQLSLITETFLIMHVNIETFGNENLKPIALKVANHLLARE